MHGHNLTSKMAALGLVARVANNAVLTRIINTLSKNGKIPINMQNATMVKRLKNANTHLRRLNTLQTMTVHIGMQRGLHTLSLFPGISSLQNMDKVLGILNAKFGPKYGFDCDYLASQIQRHIYVFRKEKNTNAQRASEFIHTRIFPAAVTAICTIMREKGYVAEPARPSRPDQSLISFYAPGNRKMF
jgi:hypothetical protein